jgi:hypothetical protein
MPVRVKNSTTGAGSDSGKKTGVCASALKVQSRADVNEGFLETIFPSGEVTLHSSANVQRHDAGVWSDENPHEKTEHALSINCSTFAVY